MPSPRENGARPRLTVAPEVARRRLRARLLVWAVALVTVVSLFTLVAFHVFAAQSAFTLQRLSKERATEQLRYERMRERWANLSSAPTVIAEAKKLGMVQGPGVIDLPVPSVQFVGSQPPAPAGESPSGSYTEAKKALDPTR